MKRFVIIVGKLYLVQALIGAAIGFTYPWLVFFGVI